MPGAIRWRAVIRWRPVYLRSLSTASCPYFQDRSGGGAASRSLRWARSRSALSPCRPSRRARPRPITRPVAAMTASGSGREDQARLADHPREQVLRRHLHRPEQQHLPVEDAAEPGRLAEELLRHRSLQPRQLRLPGQRPGDSARHAGGLPLLYQFCRVGEHEGLAAHQPELRPDDLGRGPERGGQAPTAASTRRRSRRCSTSSTARTSAGRATPRTWATPTPAALRTSAGKPSSAALRSPDRRA